jgi:hypothetical protein
MPRKNPNLDLARSIQLNIGQWERIQRETRKDPDLAKRPSAVLRELIDEALDARQQGGADV